MSPPAIAANLPAPARDSDFHDNGHPDPAKVHLGQLLFFDKILGGNKNTSCATCHHDLIATTDGVSLSIGEGGRGLGMTRDTGTGPDAVREQVGRNAQQLFNLGAREYHGMFWEARVEVDPSQPSGFHSPAGDQMPIGMDSVLAAQSLIPMRAELEMVGQANENSVAAAAAVGHLTGPGGAWTQLAERIQAIPEYVDLFKSVYPDVLQAQDISIRHIGNAIAAFENVAYRATNSPFDRYLNGERTAMSPAQLRGMSLFYGKARCYTCHSGTFQTDQGFHAIAMPQIGPGKGNGPDGHDDYGREIVTGNPADRFKFKTPSLRNVMITGPWGHDGAYNSVEAVIRHHMNPARALENYDTSQAVLQSRPDLDAKNFLAQSDPSRRADLAAHSEIDRIRLSDAEVASVLDFLNALTDPASLDMRHNVPMRVPSGLPLAE